LLELPKFLNGGNWALLLSMINVVTTWCGSSCTATSSTSMPMSQDGGPASRQSLTPSWCQVGHPWWCQGWPRWRLKSNGNN
jgi:hypothetical protein